jgi:hypothetical protein
MIEIYVESIYDNEGTDCIAWQIIGILAPGQALRFCGFSEGYRRKRRGKKPLLLVPR